MNALHGTEDKIDSKEVGPRPHTLLLLNLQILLVRTEGESPLRQLERGACAYAPSQSFELKYNARDSMPWAFYVFPSVAVLLEGLLLWRLSQQHLWSRYPYLSLFVAYGSLGDVLLFPINRYKPAWFPVAYWRIETVALFLQFLINWEFYRGIFWRSTLRELAWKVLLVVELGLLPAILALGWSQASSVPVPHLPLSPVIEQYTSFAQALLLLATAAIASYYRMPLGKNLRGLGLGFGVYLLLRVVNFATVQAFPRFRDYWRLLTPMTFIGMLAIWLWAFWQFAPSAECWSMDEIPYTQWKTEWQQVWIRIRRVLGGGASP